jgi:hypothetical protein
MERREELIHLIKRLTTLDFTEDEEPALVARIKHLSPDPEWSNYIFYSEEYVGADGVLDAERLVDKLLSYRPICL